MSRSKLAGIVGSPMILLIGLLALLIVSGGSLYLSGQADGPYLAKTFKRFNDTSQNQSAMAISGFLYVDSRSDGWSYGASFQGIYNNQDTKYQLVADTGPLVYGSQIELVGQASSGQSLLRVTGLEDITGVFIVGHSDLDSRLATLISHKKSQLANVWFDLKALSGEPSYSLIDWLLGALADRSRSGNSLSFGSAYQQYPFMEIMQVSRGEVLEKVATRHYFLKVDHQKLSVFKDQVLDLPGSGNQYSQKVIDGLNNLQLWTSDNSKELKQVYFETEVDNKLYSLRLRFDGPINRLDLQLPQPTEPRSTLEKLIKD